LSPFEPQSVIQSAADILNLAEKELTAYARAVSELFGAEHARQAVEDWIEELELTEWSQGNTGHVWRHVTVAAAVRLANRTKFGAEEHEEERQISAATPNFAVENTISRMSEESEL
jgi:hypothetical protein